jgi:hypothetical protein
MGHLFPWWSVGELQVHPLRSGGGFLERGDWGCGAKRISLDGECGKGDLLDAFSTDGDGACEESEVGK